MTIGIIIAVVVAVMAVVVFEALRTPAGIERECSARGGRIFTRTRTATNAGCDEVIHLLQTDWSWWKRARAGEIKELGNGQKGFYFHPLRFFGFLEFPTTILIRLERVESLPDGGKRIHATLTGDFEGQAEYTARPAGGGSVVELAWCGAEVKGFWRFSPIASVAAVHAWRERLGAEGLRDRLRSAQPHATVTLFS